MTIDCTSIPNGPGGETPDATSPTPWSRTAARSSPEPTELDDHPDTGINTPRHPHPANPLGHHGPYARSARSAHPHAVTERIITHVRRGWPHLGQPIVHHRGQFCYVSAMLPGCHEPTPILRLRYQGSIDHWNIAIYLASDECYTENELPTFFGPKTGTPEQGIDHAFILYAGSKTAPTGGRQLAGQRLDLRLMRRGEPPRPASPVPISQPGHPSLAKCPRHLRAVSTCSRRSTAMAALLAPAAAARTIRARTTCRCVAVGLRANAVNAARCASSRPAALAGYPALSSATADSPHDHSVKTSKWSSPAGVPRRRPPRGRTAVPPSGP
jgi:hypothetical protein